jgi:hypothetical protein
VTKLDEKNFNLNLSSELNLIVYMLVDTKFFEYLNSNNIDFNFKKVYSQFKKTTWYKLINKISSEEQIQLFLFDIMFPEQFQRMVMGERFKKTIPRKLYVPFDDIVFIVENYSKPKKIIKYFYSKIK